MIKNIGSNQNVRIKEIVKAIKQNFENNKSKIKIIYRSKAFKKVKMYKYRIDNKLNSKKNTNFKKGIDNLIKFIANNNGKV